MRGRKPTPTHLKLVSGNPGHRPLNQDEPQPEGDLVEPPHWFSPDQRLIWDRVIRDAPDGLLRRLDAAVLETWVIAKSLHDEAAQKIAKVGTLIAAPVTGHPMKNPFIQILNQQAHIMLKCASEMGFSPSSRSRVAVTRKGRKSNVFAKLREIKLE